MSGVQGYKFGEHLEIPKNVERIIGIRPRALIRNFKPIVNHTNPINTSKQSQRNTTKRLILVAVCFPYRARFWAPYRTRVQNSVIDKRVHLLKNKMS